MQTVEFYGAGDDLVEIEGDIPGCDEYPGGDEPSEFIIRAGEEAMLVVAFYGGKGTWAFAPGIVDEGAPFPAWPLRFAVKVRPEFAELKPGTYPDPYSMSLVIEVPDDARLDRV